MAEQEKLRIDRSWSRSWEEELRAALKKEMETLEAKSKEEWEEAKQKVRAAGDELEHAYNKVRDKFKSE